MKTVSHRILTILLLTLALGDVAAQQTARNLLDFPRNLTNDADRQALREAAASALNHQPDRTTTGWKNAETGTFGLFRPLKTYESEGKHCRRMKLRISADGQSRDWVFNFCQTDGGTWKIAP